jgi:hypothetical protein
MNFIIASGEEFFVANVDAPCEDRARQRLRDFNVVKHMDERGSSRVGSRSWITSLLTGSLRITTWWTFPCTGESSLGLKGMVSRWAALTGFCFQKSGVLTGQTVSRWPGWEAYPIITLWLCPQVRKTGDLGPLGC